MIASLKLSDADQVRQLSRQVSVLRWVFPLVLFGIVAVFETNEHIIVNRNADNNFTRELIIFGIIGPSLVFFVLSWIHGSLLKLAKAYDEIRLLNADLERQIETRTRLHILLGEYLEQEDYAVFHAYDGQQGLHTIFEERVDLAVVDVMMPNMNGWTVLERIREMSELPVILLTALNSEPDKLRGFRLGSDDYVTKPFSFAELAARMNTILKRSKNRQPNPNVLTVGDLILDPIHHQVTLSGKAIELTPTEFRLLAVLMGQPGRVFTKAQLVRLVVSPN